MNASEQLKDFDDTHLDKLRVLLYDRWNWDSGSERDKIFLDEVEQEVENRKMNGSNPSDADFAGGSYLRFVDPNDSAKEVKIGVSSMDGSFLIKTNSYNNQGKVTLNNQEVLEVSYSAPKFGYGLENEVRRMAKEEIDNKLRTMLNL